jgi:hypothetical protein
MRSAHARRSAVSGRVPPNTPHAAATSSQRMRGLPAVVITPRRCLPPELYSVGTSPRYAATGRHAIAQASSRWPPRKHHESDAGRREGGQVLGRPPRQLRVAGGGGLAAAGRTGRHIPSGPTVG